MTRPADGRPDEHLSAEVVVIGSGPAGLAAAVSAWRGGASVLLLDGDARPGGQYWRHPAGAGPDRHHHPGEYRELAEALEVAAAAGRLQHRAGHRVWRLDRLGEAEGAVPGSGGVQVQAVTGTGRAEQAVAVRARAVVLATGTSERALPFPGWDLPGVLTAGAAQALLAEHGVPAGRRVVVGGTGPFLLPVAAALADAGAEVLGIHEANGPRGWASGWRGVLGAPAKLAEGAAYAARLAQHRVPVRLRSAVVAAHGTDRVEAVTVARLDRDWRVLPGSGRRLACDAVAVGWGFAPRIDLAVQLGCPTRPGPDGAPVLAVDRSGGTGVPGVFAAGEVTGVGGAALAVLEGEVAGRAAARHARGARFVSSRAAVLGPRSRDGAPLRELRRRRLEAFAAAMHAAHPVRDGWITWLAAGTLVCRCEEVPLHRLDEAVELGATDARTAKLLSRCGMGWCQGRVCSEPVARIVAARLGAAGQPVADGLRGAAGRPLAVPVRLGTLAGTGAPGMPENRAGSPDGGRPGTDRQDGDGRGSG